MCCIFLVGRTTCCLLLTPIWRQLVTKWYVFKSVLQGVLQYVLQCVLRFCVRRRTTCRLLLSPIWRHLFIKWYVLQCVLQCVLQYVLQFVLQCVLCFFVWQNNLLFVAVANLEAVIYQVVRVACVRMYVRVYESESE